MRSFKKHKISPDPVYHSIYIAMFANKLMLDGKKTVAYKIIYDAIDSTKDSLLKQYPSVQDAFAGMIHNIRPSLGVKTRRIGGANYKVPFSIPEEKSVKIGIKMLVEQVRKKIKSSGTNASDALRKEILDILNGNAETLKEKDRRHKMAESNKAYAHFA